MRGEDVVLSNVSAFDFRVWDPNVQVCGYAPLTPGELVEGLVPGDPGYNINAVQTNTQGFGAFIDMGCVDSTISPANLALFNAMQRNRPGVDDNGNGVIDDPDEDKLNPQFIDRVTRRSTLGDGTATIGYVYDPWTLRYETDTYNEDQFVVPEFPPGDNTPDDGGETEAPYPHPLKALQVRIRMYESDTRQVKQVSQSIEFAR
jgi:hypothetical protein